MSSGSSVYRIRLANESEFYMTVKDDFAEYRLTTFLIMLKLGKIIEVKKIGPCLATIGDALLEPSAHFEHLISAARQGNLTPKEAEVILSLPANFPSSNALV